ncbi:MAG: efflux RND transporter periplasmic adaptor subunit, partial [bacterium]
KKIWIVVVIVLLATAAIYFKVSASKTEKKTDEPPLSIAKVERGPIRLAVESTGRVVSNLDVEIKCKASGEVTQLAFDISDKVKKGDLLVQIDPVDEQRRVNQAEVGLSSSQARLTQSQFNYEVARQNLETEKTRAQAQLQSAQASYDDLLAKAARKKELLDKKYVSQEEYDTAQTASVQARSDLETAKARIEDLKSREISLEATKQDVVLAQADTDSDKINLELARQALTDTKVYAPIDGVVSDRKVAVGQIISSGISNVGGGTTMLTLSDLSRIFILASVDESDIGKVKVGQSAVVTADAYPEKTFTGNVVRIATSGASVSNVVTFEVKLEVLGEGKELLKPQMTANVEIVAAEKELALLVPADAVTRQQGQRVVYVQKPDGTTEERPVEVGISDGFKVEIMKGLNEGEEVAYQKGMGDSRWRNNPNGPPGGAARPMGMMMAVGRARRG